MKVTGELLIRKKYLIIGLCFFVKLASVLFLGFLNEKNHSNIWTSNPLLANYSGDSDAYIQPMENYIREGEYYFAEGQGTVYSGRAPYYASIYYVFRLFSNPYVSYDLVVLTQLLLESIAGFLMVLIILRLTGSAWTSLATLVLFCVSTYQTEYTSRILTESISSSALIFFIYYFQKLQDEKTSGNYLRSGFWLAVATVLKPYLAPLFILIFFYYDSSKSFSANFRLLVIFGVSLLVITAPFTIRNFVRFNRLQPFSDYDGGVGFTEADNSYRNYLKSVGESIVYWDPDCAACHFTNRDVPCNYIFPDYFYSKNTDPLDIDRARKLYIDYLNERNQWKEKIVIAEFDKLTLDFREAHPFRYYIGSRVRLLKNFVFQKATYYMPNPFTGIMKLLVNAIKGVEYLIYYLVILTGLGGMIYFLFKDFHKFILLGAIPAYLLVFFPLVLRVNEWRYWSSAYYVLLLLAVYSAWRIKRRMSTT